MKTITILIFALAITYAFAAAACPNPLGTKYGTAQTTVQATFASANKVCASLNTAADSCCTMATVDGFQTNAATLVSDLETLATAKDKAILDNRKTLAGLQSKLATLKAAYTAAETKLTAQVTAGTANAAAVKTYLTNLNTDVATFFTSYNTLRTNFDAYQTKRATCLTALAKAQVAGWCIGCNQNFDVTYGIGGTGTAPTVAFEPAFLTVLRDACYPYFVASAEQTNIIRLAQRPASVDTYTAGLVKIAADDNTGIASINTAIPTTIPATVSAVPTGCTASACDWIKDSLFPAAQLDKTLAIRGGSEPTSRRILQSANPGRMLAGTFGTATTLTDEPKITIAVKANPGGVTNPNDLSALRVGVFSCIVAFFVALLI
jgi:hypothetical protein